ncbi:MAG: elongation factor P [Lachnospiraceae bacterium]|nr:elongation factor P [Lachnospiraceae bacterium]
MINAGDFRKGITFEYKNSVYMVLDFLHVKPGKGSPFVRTKLKDVIYGGVVEDTFNPSDKYPLARIDKKDMQFLFKDGDMYTFMDVETYDQFEYSTDIVGDAMEFVKENEICKICSFKEKVISIEPPLFVELEVTDTEPGVRGNTATNVTKPATVETGATIKVPIFINNGDVIKIDTRTKEYLSRA